MCILVGNNEQEVSKLEKKKTLGSIKPKMSYSKQHAISAALSVQLLCYELELMEESGVPLQCYHSM